MNCSDISAVIVTKGDQDLKPILESLSYFDDIVVWDNSKEPVDRKVYGRYLAIERCKHEFIYVQDDDCIVPAQELAKLAPLGSLGSAESWVPEGIPSGVLCNVPSKGHRDYYDPLGMSLVGWGAIFHRSLARSFDRYFALCPVDELFDRECDRVFTALNPFLNMDIGMRHLEHAKGADRMGRESRHYDDLQEIRRRIARVKATNGKPWQCACGTCWGPGDVHRCGDLYVPSEVSA